MASHKKSIQDALMTALATINGSPTYNTTIPASCIFKVIQDSSSITTSPFVTVAIGATNKKLSNNGDPPLYEATTDFIIIAAFKQASDVHWEGTLSDAVVALQEDIEECIIKSESLMIGASAPAWQMELVSEPPIVDVAAGYAEAIVHVLATYYHGSEQ